ncbi:DUF2520 domain-containing protein [Microbulbifer sp. A4B17]|uniref:Rossmann-like and DUF2520 domain-containing protein n=1 Tax=Microbulbifer sp. A4B17 TaxID=359370 RepID=UPI000D52E61D|nr:Rossmann-like and DUF2520 domain-containing protein [Microbulbifer sp. A4B17]AWF82222.1 DUF2520 domain-containing protein [Microbulbifer sp. A4B17]
MQSLNIIGAGRLGKTLGRLWQESGVFQVQSIYNRSLESGLAASRFIGAGNAVESLAAMPAADLWLIGCIDSEIAVFAHQLAENGLVDGNTLVFHCSGALSSQILEPLKPALIASAHPVHSFAEPETSLQTFASTSVAIEGDSRAIEILSAAFAVLGCEILTIDPNNKSLYHAGSVIASNYLTTLMDLSLQSFAAAGIERDSALRLLAPIVSQTLQNNMTLGPEKSLTGPIARGDVETVGAQVESLASVDSQLALCYRHLGLACVELARRGSLSPESAARLIELLSEPTR